MIPLWRVIPPVRNVQIPEQRFDNSFGAKLVVPPFYFDHVNCATEYVANLFVFAHCDNTSRPSWCCISGWLVGDFRFAKTCGRSATHSSSKYEPY